MLNICFSVSEATVLSFELSDERSTYGFESLDCGRIHPSDFAKAREEWVYNAYPLCSENEKKQILSDAFQRHSDILKEAERSKELRIWYASNPASTCGFFHLVHSLHGIDCKIYVVELPSSTGGLSEYRDRSWDEIDPDDIRPSLKHQRLLDSLEREAYERIWELLFNENAELRINVNGRITSVPLDHLDNEILSYAPLNTNFKFGNLVGLAMKSAHYMHPSFIASRIEAMISNRKIALIERSDDPEQNDFCTILRVE